MLADNFPKTVTVNSVDFVFRLATPQDRNRILAMAQKLSESELLFMRRDITQPEAVDDWMRDIEMGRATTVLVEVRNEIIAYGSLYYNLLFWNRHLGEMRVMVRAAYRNRGIGTKIARELVLFAQELQLEKVVTYIAVDDKGAQRMVEDFGFRPEALLADWVKTRDERTQDLLIMSTALNEIRS